jgi:hypothetical protein
MLKLLFDLQIFNFNSSQFDSKTVKTKLSEVENQDLVFSTILNLVSSMQSHLILRFVLGIVLVLLTYLRRLVAVSYQRTQW